MSLLELVQSDQIAIAQVLQDRRAVTTVTLPVGVRLVWTIYLTILEDALTTLGSLISFLTAEQRQNSSPEIHSTSWLDARMIESTLEPKKQLAIYKTMVDENKSQLLELSLRHDAMLTHLTDAINGESYDLLNTYLKQLRSTLIACDAVRKAIDKGLTEMDDVSKTSDAKGESKW
jgi:hypothetical protein